MGPSLLTRPTARWFHSMPARRERPVVEQHNLLAQTFIDQGHVEGVRGDLAFVQSILETGGSGTTRSSARRTTAGMNAYDGCAGSQAASTATRRRPVLPVHASTHAMQLLRSYADATSKNSPPVSAPSDRVGAPIWEYFGGTTAVRKAHLGERGDYGITSSSCTRRRSSTTG
jgi:hypothetical protein